MGPSAETTTTEASPSAADHNDADIRFVQAMTLHDEEAVAMAALADGLRMQGLLDERSE